MITVDEIPVLLYLPIAGGPVTPIYCVAVDRSSVRWDVTDGAITAHAATEDGEFSESLPRTTQTDEQAREVLYSRLVSAASRRAAIGRLGFPSPTEVKESTRLGAQFRAVALAWDQEAALIRSGEKRIAEEALFQESEG